VNWLFLFKRRLIRAWNPVPVRAGGLFRARLFHALFLWEVKMMEKLNSEQEVVLKNEKEKEDLEAGKMRVVDKDFYDFAMDADQCFFDIDNKVSAVLSALLSYNDGSTTDQDKDSVIRGCETILRQVTDSLGEMRARLEL